MCDATTVISGLPPKGAKMVAVEILLADPESLHDDVLEACLYIFRERLRTACPPSRQVPPVTGSLRQHNRRSLPGRRWRPRRTGRT
jgi:hypothetical protein